MFALSPDAVTSDVALKEVAQAASLNKRFAPIVCRRVDDAAVPELLRRLNFIFFDDPARFDAAADKLAEALRADIGWIRQHTEFGEAARRWALAGRPGGLLLRSPVLEEAERWIASRPRGAPEPTAETQALVAGSRRGTTRRRNILTGSLAAGLLVALGLAGFAYWQRGEAIVQRRIADEQRIAADAQRNIAEQQRTFAEEQRNAAQEQRNIAEQQRAVANQQRKLADEQREAAVRQRDNALMAQSRFLAELASRRTNLGDATTAALLALEALPDPKGQTLRPYAPEAEGALFEARMQLRRTTVLAKDVADAPKVGIKRHFDEYNRFSAQWSPDGLWVLTVAESQSESRIWSRSGDLIAGLRRGTGGVFSPDSRTVAVLSGGTIHVSDVETGKTVGDLRTP